MTYENLLKSVEESAQEREREIRDKAQSDADAIKTEALKQAEAIQQSLLEAARMSAMVERNKLIYLTKAENKDRLIATREKLYLQAFASASNRLAELRTDQQYPEVFKKLAVEAMSALGQEKITIRIDKRDERLCKEIMTGLKQSCEITTDLQIAGGLIVSSPDGSIIISNTVESRLERGRERLKLEVFSVLSGR